LLFLSVVPFLIRLRLRHLSSQPCAPCCFWRAQLFDSRTNTSSTSTSGQLANLWAIDKALKCHFELCHPKNTSRLLSKQCCTTGRMCRFLVYKGSDEILLSKLILDPTHSILTQSFDSRLRLDMRRPHNGPFGTAAYLLHADSMQVMDLESDIIRSLNLDPNLAYSHQLLLHGIASTFNGLPPKPHRILSSHTFAPPQKVP